MSRWKELKENPLKKELLIKRSHLITVVREFFLSQDFIECETPLLVRYPGMEPHLSPFPVVVRNEHGEDHQGYLITSPEYSMKKLLAAGFQKIFQLSKVFRNNESFGGTHNPEFTMIEWYRAGADYRKIMEDVEQLFTKLHPAPTLTYQNQEINLTRPWLRITVKEAFDRFAAQSLEALAPRKNEAYEDTFFKIFLNEVEPKLKALARPVFIYDYPAELAALAKLKERNRSVAERFELYLGGLELCNAFSELMDGPKQEARLIQEQNQRRTLEKPILDIDLDFIKALDHGPKTAAGIALGLDRLIMLLLDQKDISEVLWFGTKDIF